MSGVPDWAKKTKTKAVEAVRWIKKTKGRGGGLPDNVVSIGKYGNVANIRLADNLISKEGKIAEYSYLEDDEIVIMHLSSEGEGYTRRETHKGKLKNSFTFPRGLMRKLDIQPGRYPAYLDNKANNVFINIREPYEKHQRGSARNTPRASTNANLANKKPSFEISPRLDSINVKVRCPECNTLNSKKARSCRSCGIQFYKNEKQYLEMLNAAEDIEVSEG